ncbi:hypothetical protein AVEN_739-1 [Araneus ventricosus]|uniref:Uncharacterized protein n=1 Tax=Araneus ventricosus TaxID=182803 RepID=A0A4Y2BFK4_ARAVE|nr:hypothetical protein AVEN_739-1 [Araneus ventricosus]
MGSQIVDIVKQIDSGKEDSFLCMYTAAKNVIQSNMRVKQIKSFHAVFDMVYGLFWRYMHEKVVSPSLSKMIPPRQLKEAYDTYQKYIQKEEEGNEFELQCLLYCIQEEMERENPSKIPNPLYSRLTQQMKAMSEYIITLLVSVSLPNVVKPSTETTPSVRAEQEWKVVSVTKPSIETTPSIEEEQEWEAINETSLDEK